jgi:D-tyrosyl-tRNA(Tyr) deacylase
VGDEVVGHIGRGLLVLLGVGDGDSESDADYLVDKTVHLRIFPDAEGRLNRSCLDSGGAVLAVSQFTLYGDCRKGRRPGFTQAAEPGIAQALYERYASGLESAGLSVARGHFRAEMDVALVNHGPVTLLLDSRRLF